jgi:hypothetical protein
VLGQEASDALVKAYVEMRNVGADARSNERRITATTRQLESMIRLSEAHARMRYSLHVEVSHIFLCVLESGTDVVIRRDKTWRKPLDSSEKLSKSPPYVPSLLPPL